MGTNKDKQSYVLIYATVLTLIVAIVLSAVGQALEPAQAANALEYKKKDILSAVGKGEEKDVNTFFENNIQTVVLDVNGNIIEGVNAIDVDVKAEKKKADQSARQLPLFIYNDVESGEKKYIVPVRGNGLWDEIWGFIALNQDTRTIFGTAFDHKGETPGLGAEISTDAFEKAFIGKEVCDVNFTNFHSVEVRKGALTKPNQQVQAISGATMTCDGVTEMLKSGIALYLPYFETQIKN